jgi:shikimate 5-dehydrogenase
MNKGNTIGMATKLYGFISEYAQQNRFSVVLNSLFRADGINMMMIPMNIREDDIYFTVSNMKKSHVNGAYIAHEYQTDVIDLLDEKDEIVEVYGKCDFVIRYGEKLRGYLIEKNDVKSLDDLAQNIVKIMKEN